jgi:hypothetical protein
MTQIRSGSENVTDTVYPSAAERRMLGYGSDPARCYRRSDIHAPIMMADFDFDPISFEEKRCYFSNAAHDVPICVLASRSENLALGEIALATAD